MIKASELRSGNLVIKKSFGTTPNHIDKVDGAYIKWVEEDGAECYGIVLTTEILEKCGFKYVTILDDEQDYRGDYFVKYGVKLYRDPGEECYYFRFGDTELYPVDKYEIEIKHLHQLQNLYFALKGEELNIELNAPVSDTTEA